ncbi:uncharacterized protein LOC126717811 [Quercus robur]|uniref:uncharacterized protein LOC126717811 n=1 Tax=Quercus robur TaxID=38942 RepID=UPI002161687D|nr:uncharacterized protein LOC126717811 [Quercus robur]
MIQHQWRPPDPQNYKANFDAAVFKATNTAALACRRPVQFAWEIGLRRVTFEGNSAAVIQAITRGNSDFLPFGNIIDDIRNQVAGFQFSEFFHAYRICNTAADALAKKAKLCTGLQVWLEDIPADIAPLVSFDTH